MMKRAPICGLAVLSLAAASPPKRLYLDPHSAMIRTAARLWGVARADAAVLSAAWFTGGGGDRDTVARRPSGQPRGGG